MTCDVSADGRKASHLSALQRFALHNTFWKVETASKAAVRWFNAMEFPTFHALFLFYLPLALNHQQALL